MLLTGEHFTGFFQGRLSIGLSSTKIDHGKNIVIVFGHDGEHQLVVTNQKISAERLSGGAK